MNEKRFTYGETIDYNFFDVFEEKKYLGMIQRDSTKIIDRLNELVEENEQLRQIMNDIVVATDETYAKNASVFKVTVVLDFEKYMEIRRCIE